MSDLPTTLQATPRAVAYHAGVHIDAVGSVDVGTHARPTAGEAHMRDEGDGALISLAALVAALPDDVVVPIRWVRERMAADQRIAMLALGSTHAPKQEHAVLTRMLTAKEYGERRVPARSTEWVRDLCRAGGVVGARKDGREWMIPSTALTSESPQGAPVARESVVVHAALPTVQRTSPMQDRARAKNAPRLPRWGAR